MQPVKIKTDYYELDSLLWAMSEYPPGGRDAASLMAKSILNKMKMWMQMRTITWSQNERSKRSKHTVTWLNHEARAIALYITGLVSNDHILDIYKRTCIDTLRINLLKQL